MASLQAHIAEHLGFSYRKKIEEKLGAPLPAPNEELPEEIEVQLSRLVADAGKQLTQTNKQQAAQRAAQQKAQDPIIQMKQAELQVKQQEQQRKAAKDQAELKQKEQKMLIDAKIASEQINIDKAELAIDAKRQGVKEATAKRVEDNKVELELARIAQKERQ
jgi:hypothetical protein